MAIWVLLFGAAVCVVAGFALQNFILGLMTMFLVCFVTVAGAMVLHARGGRPRKPLRTERLELFTNSAVVRPKVLAAMDDDIRLYFGWDGEAAATAANRPQLLAFTLVGELVGSFALSTDPYADNTSMIDFWITKEFRNQGYGREFFAASVALQEMGSCDFAIELASKDPAIDERLLRYGFVRSGVRSEVTSDGRAVEIGYFLKRLSVGRRQRRRVLGSLRRSLAVEQPIGAAAASQLPFGLVSSGRVQMRQANRFDAADVVATIDDMATAGISQSISPKKVRSLVGAEIAGGHSSRHFLVLEPNSQAVIGVVTLGQVDARTSTWAFGMWLAAEYRGQGYARDVIRGLSSRLRDLGVERLACCLLPVNERLRPMLLSERFVEIGHRPGADSNDERWPLFERHLALEPGDTNPPIDRDDLRVEPPGPS